MASAGLPGMVESGVVFHDCKHTFCSSLSHPHSDGDAPDLLLLPVVQWKGSPQDTFSNTAWPSLTTICKLLTLSLVCWGSCFAREPDVGFLNVFVGGWTVLDCCLIISPPPLSHNICFFLLLTVFVVRLSPLRFYCSQQRRRWLFFNPKGLGPFYLPTSPTDNSLRTQ